MKKTIITGKVLLLVMGITRHFIMPVHGCGGGVVPYVPTQSGASNSSKGQFFLVDKSAATDMFDVKKLQPLFRNIVLTGNERNVTKLNKKLTGKKSNEIAQDSVRSRGIQSVEPSSDSIVPILNLHRLH